MDQLKPTTNNNPALGHIVCQPITSWQVRANRPDRPYVRVKEWLTWLDMMQVTCCVNLISWRHNLDECCSNLKVIERRVSGPGPTEASPDRRCSTRLLSASVHQTLKQLQKEQYEQRVAQLIQRNKIFYRYSSVQFYSWKFCILSFYLF